MRNPFRRTRGAAPARAGHLDSRLRSGAYTVEIPDIGAGHYVYDPRSDCPIHSERLEPWCDVDAEDVAREELHWHSRLLSEHGIPADSIRESGEKVISGRRSRRIASLRSNHEAEMANLEGAVKTVETRINGEREKVADAERREQEIRTRAEAVRREVKEKQLEHDQLPRRARITVTLQLTITLSVSLFLFDVGIIGGAFELISGELVWKIVLAIGVALAPLSTAIGLAVWLSAAEHRVRKDRAAGILALVAAVIAIIGLLLIVPFRTAAGGDTVIPPLAFYFLAFIQVGLGMAETMLYTVYFDSKVGVAMRKQIVEMGERVGRLEGLAEREVGRKQTAEDRIKQIEREAAEQHALLDREENLLSGLPAKEDGVAEILRGVVDSAILEGEMGRQRRDLRDLDSASGNPEVMPGSGIAYASLAVASLAVLFAGIQYF